jgi:hypothetical protein
MLSCSGTMDYKLLAKAGLVCGQGPATAVLTLGSNDKPCILGILDRNYFIIP